MDRSEQAIKRIQSKKQSVASIRARIAQYRKDKSFRPTVVVPVLNHLNEALLVRNKNPEENLALIQGEIELLDKHPLAAALRESNEEAGITPDDIAETFPDLGSTGIVYPERMFNTGYTHGGFYFFVGIKLHAHAYNRVLHSLGSNSPFIECMWCSSIEHAVQLLEEQPGAKQTTASFKKKIDQVLIPALQCMYKAETSEMHRLLKKLY